MVRDGDVVSGGLLECGIKVGVESQVLFVLEHLDVAVPGSVFLQDVQGGVCRAIVSYDDFMDGISLREDGVHLFAQILFPVVSAHHHRYRTVSHVHCFLSAAKLGVFFLSGPVCPFF